MSPAASIRIQKPNLPSLYSWRATQSSGRSSCLTAGPPEASSATAGLCTGSPFRRRRGLISSLMAVLFGLCVGGNWYAGNSSFCASALAPGRSLVDRARISGDPGPRRNDRGGRHVPRDVQRRRVVEECAALIAGAGGQLLYNYSQ